MSEIDQLVRFEVANSAVEFRERAYGDKDRQEFLRDLLGLANAEVDGPRYLFVGVSDTLGGDRSIVGVPEADAARLHKLTRRLVDDFIEPLLDLQVDERLIDGERVVAIILRDCTDPPYLLKRNASSAMRVGSGWIRRGTEFRRIGRADLQRIFESKLLSRSATAELRIGFAGRLVEQVLHLPALPLEQLPSEVASGKIRQLLAAKQVADEQCTDERTRMQRLVHAQLFGASGAYQPESERTLMQRLEQASEEHEAADRYYAFEERAHKVNLVVENVGRAPFEHGTLVLDFPRMDGFEVIDRLWPPPDGPQPVAAAYPTVDVGPRTVRVQTTVSPIAPGSRGMAFDEPLRLGIREDGAGNVVPINFTLYGGSVRAPISGALRIHIDEPEQRQVRAASNE